MARLHPAAGLLMGIAPGELRVEQLPDLPAGEAEWRKLALAAGNPFSTWEWASAWWTRFGDGRPQRILGCRDADGELVGVLPLYASSRRPRTLRFIGNGPADQLGPICAEGNRDAVAAALLRHLGESRGWDACVAERMPVGEGWRERLGGVLTRTELTPTVAFGGDDWDEYLATRSAHFRQQVRRLERKLAKEHELEFRLAGDPERLRADMDCFIDLHEARWAARGTTSKVFSGALREFHHEVAAQALDGGWLRLCFAELDGTPRAATYGFRLGQADWFYQTGRDPDFDQSRVGQVLLNHTVREACTAGRAEFKFLLGEEGYKSRYTDEDDFVETLALTRNLPAKALLGTLIGARNGARSLRGRLRRGDR